MITKYLINITLLFVSIILFELVFASLFLIRGSTSVSILFQPFLNYETSKLTSKIVYFDYSNQKLLPGKYNDGEKSWVINSNGFRGPEFIKENSECLGIAYGGSTTLALEVSYEETYPAILEKKLNELNHECNILNFGVSSKSLKYIFERLVYELNEYSPNYILINNNRNSAMYDSISSKIFGDIVTNRLSLNIFKFDIFLENNIMSYNFLKKSYARFNELKSETPHPIIKNRKIDLDYFYNGYYNILEQIYTLTSDKNIKLILVKQPYYIEPDVQTNLSKRKINENLSTLKEYYKINLSNLKKNQKLDNKQKYNNYFMLSNVILNQQFDILKNKYQDILVVDPLEKFYQYKKESVTFDGLHLTKLGNEILSEEISRAIIKEKITN